ncbi:hypothetical protein Tco_0919892 [Tanacetum coccineum]
MSTPTFADTHNMVAFLDKPAESDGFHEIIDFLNANQIRYALTVNPTIYTSCIQQFWATAKAKTVNGVRQIQALIDKKKLIITETSIRSDLHLEDAGGTDCLPTATIFEELARMGKMHLNKGGRIKYIDADAEMFVDATAGEKDKQSTRIINSTAGEAVTTAGVGDSVVPIIPTTVEETFAQTLMEIKAAKPKAKGIVFHDVEKQSMRGTFDRKSQVAFDEDLARNIQAQLDTEIIEEERLERQKQVEANIALIESWENIQAMIEADRLMAKRLQTREREELTDEEKGKLFMELMKKRRKHFAALRA